MQLIFKLSVDMFPLKQKQGIIIRYYVNTIVLCGKADPEREHYFDAMVCEDGLLCEKELYKKARNTKL